MGQEERETGGRMLAWLRDANAWRNLVNAGLLLIITVAAALVYAAEPQSPRDLLDQLSLAVRGEAYGPNLRRGERFLVRAFRAEAAGVDSLSEAYAWGAVRCFGRAGAAAPGPREAMAANDRLADAYLRLGWTYLERGRGGAFGIGGNREAVEAARRVAACVVGVAPTRRRAAINSFVEELEEVMDEELEEALDRPAGWRCPG